MHNATVPGDSQLTFTTLGWMMWNHLLSTLGCGACIAAYDGSPFAPSPSTIWAIASKFKITNLGLSPRYLQVLETEGYIPNKEFDLSHIKQVQTAGSVLKPELYDWMRANIHEDVWINNGTGGTDVRPALPSSPSPRDERLPLPHPRPPRARRSGLFAPAFSNSWLTLSLSPSAQICNLFIGAVRSKPIYHGELTCIALAMDLQAWDDDGVFGPPSLVSSSRGGDDALTLASLARPQATPSWTVRATWSSPSRSRTCPSGASSHVLVPPPPLLRRLLNVVAAAPPFSAR